MAAPRTRFRPCWLSVHKHCSISCENKEWSGSGPKMFLSHQIQSVHGGPDRVVGFTGQVFVSFRTTPDKLGTLLRGGLEHGANSVSQTEFTPLESEIDTARRDLAIEAMKNALARADAIAQAAGQRVI